MPKSPEVEHLERAVEAVKRGLIPEVQRRPTKEDIAALTREEPEPETGDE